MNRFNRIKNYSETLLAEAIEKNLMHTTAIARSHQHLSFQNNSQVVSFINCSYLGLDSDKRLIEGAKRGIEKWGIGYCCARTRMSNIDLRNLEEGLSQNLGGHAITFPSVTTTHQVVIPLLAEDVLMPTANKRKIFYFDKLAHNSMQSLRTYLSTLGEVRTLDHNQVQRMIDDMNSTENLNAHFYYFTDGVFSMGGISPVEMLRPLYNNDRITLYVDDAHGTSIYGKRGEGFLLSQITNEMPKNLILTFSLAKGFGCNGGGVVVPTSEMEWAIRRFGSAYCFSGPLDHSIVGAALESLAIHDSPELGHLQSTLRSRVQFFDREIALSEQEFSPIRMVRIGSEKVALAIGDFLLRNGFFVSTVFYPVVGKNDAQLRVCITARHSEEQIRQLVSCIKEAIKLQNNSTLLESAI